MRHVWQALTEGLAFPTMQTISTVKDQRASWDQFSLTQEQLLRSYYVSGKHSSSRYIAALLVFTGLLVYTFKPHSCRGARRGDASRRTFVID